LAVRPNTGQFNPPDRRSKTLDTENSNKKTVRQPDGQSRLLMVDCRLLIEVVGGNLKEP
jgi:hypothetical protein